MVVTAIMHLGILVNLMTMKEVKIVSTPGIVIVGVMHHVRQHVLVFSVAAMVSISIDSNSACKSRYL